MALRQNSHGSIGSLVKLLASREGVANTVGG